MPWRQPVEGMRRWAADEGLQHWTGWEQATRAPTADRLAAETSPWEEVRRQEPPWQSPGEGPLAASSL